MSLWEEVSGGVADCTVVPVSFLSLDMLSVTRPGSSSNQAVECVLWSVNSNSLWWVTHNRSDSESSHLRPGNLALVANHLAGILLRHQVTQPGLASGRMRDIWTIAELPQLKLGGLNRVPSKPHSSLHSLRHQQNHGSCEKKDEGAFNWIHWIPLKTRYGAGHPALDVLSTAAPASLHLNFSGFMVFSLPTKETLDSVVF